MPSFFYVDASRKQSGPVKLEQLKGLFTTGAVTEATLIFADDGSLATWTAIGKEPKVLAYCKPPAPAPAPPAPPPPDASASSPTPGLAPTRSQLLSAKRPSTGSGGAAGAATAAAPAPAPAVKLTPSKYGGPPIPPLIKATVIAEVNANALPATGKPAAAKPPAGKFAKKDAAKPTPAAGAMKVAARSAAAVKALVGKTVWVPDSGDAVYKQATVAEIVGDVDTLGVFSVKTTGGEVVASEQIAELDAEDVGETDLVQMANIDIPNILHTLKHRHSKGAVYTNVGLKGILISVNPYRWVEGLYDVKVMHDYYEAFEAKELLPHIFNLTADAYKALCVQGKSQALVTSGESGSGKTENAKQVFKFLAEIAGTQGSTIDGGGEGPSVSLESLLVNSNPVLEAFGNAKTLRNDNSSRFGKLVTVHFDGSGRIVGAYTRNYLLERTRCSTPPGGERNYHSFYQLLVGSDQTIRDRLGLASQDPTYQAMLARSNCAVVDSIDDAKEWRDTMSAARQLGFSETEIDGIVDVLGALLHLGNARFAAEKSQYGDDSAKLVDSYAVDYAAWLLGADRQTIVGGLISVRVKTARDDLMSRMSVVAAEKNRDAFVAAIYAGLFDWIVNRINEVGAQDGHADAAGAEASGRFIGVLDIFGFEIFQTNSFEQLCINFANEKLQRNFTMTTFQAEEGLYTSEGIAFEHIDYTDNQPVLDLLDRYPQKAVGQNLGGLAAKAASRGIIQLVDEEVRLPKVSDRGTLLPKMNQAFGGDASGRNGHPAYATDYRSQLAKESLFTVKHYAGDVVYCIDGFLEKSIENISAELVAAVKASSKPLIASLFSQASSRGEGGGGGGGGGGGNASRQATVGLKFSKQLASLITTIDSTQAHFIRCIKPNATKSSTSFDAPLTLEQLRYSGVFEAVAIRKSGYPFRMTHREFVLRFRLLIPIAKEKVFNWDFDDADVMRSTAEQLAKQLPSLSTIYEKEATRRGADLATNVRIGKTMIFYRSAESRALETSREEAMLPLVMRAQRTARGAVARAVRRHLAEKKRELDAAVEAKVLERLESALEQAQMPHIGFNRGKAEKFYLPIHNMAFITALLNDLRLEPVVDRELSRCCAEPNLGGANYTAIEDNHEKAVGLNERLGRPIPMLEHAEAIVGLTQGVEDHDHERLTACLESSKRLGYAARLTSESELAVKEVKMLEAGFPLEAAIAAQLPHGRSEDTGSGTWNHANVTTDSLKAALDKGKAYPLVSKSGLRLCAQASAALELRGLLTKENWALLVKCLEKIKKDASAKPPPSLKGKPLKVAKKEIAIAQDVESYEEVVSAWAELRDACAVREKALAKTLTEGRSKRLGEKRWDHSGIEVVHLRAAEKAVSDFPYVTEKGEAMLTQSKLSGLLRETLKKCDWGKPSSWAGLAKVLEASVPASLKGSEEVALTWQEFGEMRQLMEEGVTKALADGRSSRAGPGAWSHVSLSIKALEGALSELKAFPRASDPGRKLMAAADRVLRLRIALQAAKLEQPASWKNVATILDQPSEEGSADAEEMKAAREELDDARTHYMKGIRDALKLGRCEPIAGAASEGDKRYPSKMWDRSKLSAKELNSAIDACSAFPRPTAESKALIKGGKFVAELRGVLVKTDWLSAKSWGGLQDYFDSSAIAATLDQEQSAEYEDARKQLEAMRVSTELAVQGELQTGCSVQMAENSWSHDGIKVAPLKAAADECAAFPRPSAAAKALVESAKQITTLREALLQVTADKVNTWQPLANVLGSLPADDLALAEVRAALLEFRGARQKVLDAVNASMKDGCSTAPPSGVFRWDHSRLDADGLVKAAMQLEHFPKISDGASPSGGGVVVGGGVRPGGKFGSGRVAAPIPPPVPTETAAADSARRASIVAKRQSLARMADESTELVTSAKRLAQLRQLLLSESWAELDKYIKSAYPSEAGGGGGAGNGGNGNGGNGKAETSEVALEEVRRARQELHDVGAALEAAVKTALSTGRSKPGAGKGGFWDHSSLEVGPLRDAAAALSSYPLKGEAAAELCSRAEAIAKLRAAIEKKGWGELARLLKAVSGPLNEEEEVRAAASELEDMRTATETELKSALLGGRSAKNVGTKKNVMSNKDWWIALDWDHAGLEEGLQRLVAAHEAVVGFPDPKPTIQEALDQGALAIKMRELILAADWAALRKLLTPEDATPLGKMEEAVYAWQELLCYELIQATGGRAAGGKPSDQPGLKKALAEASSRGLQPHEGPVFKALQVFIDPPEYEINLDFPGDDVFPDAEGKLVLHVQVRAATTLRWLKNDVALKEGADNGRITGVGTDTLTFNSLMPRDFDQKVYCEAVNKWAPNGVRSKVVYIRIPTEARKQQAVDLNDVRIMAATKDKMLAKAKTGTPGQPGGAAPTPPAVLKHQGSSVGQHFSGRL